LDPLGPKPWTDTLEKQMKRLHLMQNKRKSKEINVFRADLDMLTFSSTKEASTCLGIPRTSLNRYTNLQNFPLYSPNLGYKVFIVDPNKPIKDTKPLLFKADERHICGIDMDSLKKGVLYAFLQDKKTIFGEFKSTHDAALKLDNKKSRHYISRYVNKERLVKVGKDRTKVYFVKKRLK